MYKFKDVLKDDYEEYNKLINDLKYIQIYKRSLMYSNTYRSRLNINNLNMTQELEDNIKEKIILYTNKIKNETFDKIFLSKNDKHKSDFIKNKSILTPDLLGLLYDFYNESKYIIAIKFPSDKYDFNSNFFLSSNLFLIKNIFLNNEIDKVYKINIDKLNNKFLDIDFFETYSKRIYDNYNQNYSSVPKIVTNNDFYTSLICVEMKYFYNNVNRIKTKKFYICNYNNLYIIKNYKSKDNKKIMSFNLFYINKITSIDNYKNYIKIDYNDIKKYYFLTQINDYLISLVKNNIKQLQM